jgi:ubiquinone/menaquinone biosynthesis C-methylase UbiE
MPMCILLRKRFFAWMMSGDDGDFDAIIAEHKRRLFSSLHGDVLEIGPGSGRNLAYLATRSDIRWVGIEPNPFMHKYLLAEAARLGVLADVRSGIAEHIDAPDGSADAVVCTHVLCSVADQQATLREVLRVLKPGGRFVFIEHVAAPQGTRQRGRQNLFRPAWQFVADGCRTNRETWTTLERAGFALLDYQRFTVPTPLVSPHIAGVGIK